MKKSGILILLAAILLALNLADTISTWIVISTGKGVEANPFVLIMGGPFSPLELVMKLVVFPAAVLTVAWWLFHKLKEARLAMLAIIPTAVGLGVVVVNNVMVAAKKVEKTAKKARKRAKA